MLTPIRVRGRRKQHPQDDPLATPRPKRPPGRPMMSFEEIASSSQVRISQRMRMLVAKPPKRHHRHAQKQLSQLERLPVELIEKIFLYSLNVNLPRSSPSLAATVSSERIYRALILLAFWDDDEATASTPGITKILRPLDYVPIGETARKALQSTLLRCKWCTLDRVLSYIPDLTHLTIQRHWFGAGIHMDPEEEHRLANYLSQTGRRKDTSSPAPSSEGLIFTGTNPTTKHPYTLTLHPPTSLHILSPSAPHDRTHRIPSMLILPDALLRGDSTAGFSKPNHLHHLETLRQASGFNRTDLVHTPITFSRSALQEGIHTAIIEANTTALTILLKIDEYAYRAAHASPADASICSPPYTLPPEHFRTAVRVARNDPTLFQTLLRTSAESMPSDDAEITQWAMELRDAFGAWLLDFMVHLPLQIEEARANPAENAVFFLGRANVNSEIGRWCLRALGVQGLATWVDEDSVGITAPMPGADQGDG